MTARSRVRFNLTALLDVILLMVFAYQIQSLQQVDVAEMSKERGAQDIEQLLAEKDSMSETIAELTAKLDSPSPASSGVLLQLFNKVGRGILQQGALERALANASLEDRAELQSFAEKMEGRDSSEVVRELAKLSSYQKYVSSWTLELLEDRGYGQGISQIAIRVDSGVPYPQSLGSSSIDLESKLSILLRDELGGRLEKSQRLVVLKVKARCGLYKRNKDEFVAVLRNRVFPGLQSEIELAGTQFIYVGEELSECQKEE